MLPKASNLYASILKTATAMFAETLDNSEHSPRFVPKSQSYEYEMFLNKCYKQRGGATGQISFSSHLSRLPDLANRSAFIKRFTCNGAFMQCNDVMLCDDTIIYIPIFNVTLSFYTLGLRVEKQASKTRQFPKLGLFGHVELCKCAVNEHFIRTTYP
jgi:hypothetical protein